MIDEPIDADIVGASLHALLRMTVVLIGWGIGIGLVTGLIVGAMTDDDRGIMCGMIVAFAAQFVVLLIVMKRPAPRLRLRSTLMAMLRAGESFRATYCFALKAASGGMVNVATHALAQAMVAAGRCNCATRIARRSTLQAIEPFTVPFAARPLDECAMDFDELQTAHSEAARAVPHAAEVAPGAALRLPRWVGRNIATSGGRIVLIPALVVAALLIWANWWRRGSILHYPWVNIGLLLAVVLIPGRKLRFGVGTWYVAPGAIIVWRPRAFRNVVDVRVYDRRRCALFTGTLVGDAWYLTVTDGNTVDRTSASRLEADFALRAFLSPLMPPDASELADFG